MNESKQEQSISESSTHTSSTHTSSTHTPKRLAMIVLIFIVGLLLGFIVVYLTLEVQNASPGDLSSGGQKVWLQMVADSFAVTGDVAAARRRLSLDRGEDGFFSRAELTELLAQQIIEADQSGAIEKARHLRHLDRGLELRASEIAAAQLELSKVEEQARDDNSRSVRPFSLTEADGEEEGGSVTVSRPSQAVGEPSLMMQELPGGKGHPTLADLWEGRAEFVLEVENTGLPMGESDTIIMSNGEFWSYVHASYRSAETIDQCGEPVTFPGCTVIYRSYDGGYTFSHDGPPICQFECSECPCTSEVDHIDQQQYPRLSYDGDWLTLFYEYRGRTMRRTSLDGLNWTRPDGIAYSGMWRLWYRDCPREEYIGDHPYVPYDYECLVGGPPGIAQEGEMLYLFVATGQNPGGLGCYKGHKDASGESFVRCENNPLLVGALDYGPLHEKGPQTNPYFDFRTISSAELQHIGDGENARYYMLFEGIRGPGFGDGGDSQFGLGLARSLTNDIDTAWEKFPNNPILVDLPGNIGLGHADLVVYHGQTLLYTSLDGEIRSRLALMWKLDQ